MSRRERCGVLTGSVYGPAPSGHQGVKRPGCGAAGRPQQMLVSTPEGSVPGFCGLRFVLPLRRGQVGGGQGQHPGRLLQHRCRPLQQISHLVHKDRVCGAAAWAASAAVALTSLSAGAAYHTFCAQGSSLWGSGLAGDCCRDGSTCFDKGANYAQSRSLALWVTSTNLLVREPMGLPRAVA